MRVLARSLIAADEVVRVPLMNAYRGDLFAAAYIIGANVDEELVPPIFGPPEEVLRRIGEAVGKRPVAFGGEGARSHAVAVEAFFGAPENGTEPVEAPTAVAIAAEIENVMRGRGPDDLAALEPQYLRPSDAKLPERALSVLTPIPTPSEE